MDEKQMHKISIATSIIYRKTQIWKTEQSVDLGLSAAQIPVVIIVCREKNISQNELGEMLGMDKSTIAKIVVKLEQDGYLVRTINAKDKRAFNLIPTEKSLDSYPQLIKIGDVWNNCLTNGMTEEEIMTLERLLVKAAQNVTTFTRER